MGYPIYIYHPRKTRPNRLCFLATKPVLTLEVLKDLTSGAKETTRLSWMTSLTIPTLPCVKLWFYRIFINSSSLKWWFLLVSQSSLTFIPFFFVFFFFCFCFFVVIQPLSALYPIYIMKIIETAASQWDLNCEFYLSEDHCVEWIANGPRINVDHISGNDWDNSSSRPSHCKRQQSHRARRPLRRRIWS